MSNLVAPSPKSYRELCLSGVIDLSDMDRLLEAAVRKSHRSAGIKSLGSVAIKEARIWEFYHHDSGKRELQLPARGAPTYRPGNQTLARMHTVTAMEMTSRPTIANFVVRTDDSYFDRIGQESLDVVLAGLISILPQRLAKVLNTSNPFCELSSKVLSEGREINVARQWYPANETGMLRLGYQPEQEGRVDPNELNQRVVIERFNDPYVNSK